MDLRVALPTEAISNTKCILCENFLTVPPISVISEDGKEYKCGRCSLIENHINIRSEALENILKHMLLPCTYGCYEKTTWDQVKTHEDVCPNRKIQCPLYYRNCNSTGRVKRLEDHFSQKHMNNIKFGNVISYNLEVDHSIVLLVMAGEEMFFVYLFVYVDFFSFSVFALQPLNKYIKYDMKITSDNSKPSIEYENMEVVHYNERLHCYRCMESECHLDYHPYAEQYNRPQTNRSQIPELKGASIKDLLGSPTAIKFFIKLRSEGEPMEATPATAKHKNNALRKNFECPICHEYMRAPIHSCKMGHSVCDVCKMWLEQCPSCQAEFEDCRNYALEALGETVELACVHEGEGCEFVGNVENIHKHEFTCSFKAQN